MPDLHDIPFYKYRCSECKQEPRHAVYSKGKIISVGSCTCTGPRTLEVIPLSKRKYLERLH